MVSAIALQNRGSSTMFGLPSPIPTFVRLFDINPMPLTGREQEILSLVAGGNSNKTIASQLGISVRTVKSHVANIMAKLNAMDRTHAVVIALKLGWIIV